MATGSGSVLLETAPNLQREVFFARFVDWGLSTPLLLMDLMFLAGMSVLDIILVVVADEIMVLTGLFAALIPASDYKWGFYGFSCLAYIYIVFKLVMVGRRAAVVRGTKVSKVFNGIALFVLIVWTLYPIVWAISEGRHLIDVDTEVGIFAVLDVLAKPVFGAWLLYAHQKFPEIGVDISEYWVHGANSAEDED